MFFEALTYLAGKSVTISTVYVIPSVMMIFEEAKSMNTIFIAIVVWLALFPTPKFGFALIAPHKIPFRADIIEPQPGVLSTMQTLNKNVFFLVTYAGKVSLLTATSSIAVVPVIACSHFTVAIVIEIVPVVFSNAVCKINTNYGFFFLLELILVILLQLFSS